MPLSPDDAKGLEEFDAEQADPNRVRRGGFVAENRLKWLRRVVGDLKARVDELEAGGVPDVIAKKDAEIAARDVQLAEHAARVAQLEAVKLPEPGKFFRDQLPMVAVTPVTDSPSITDGKSTHDAKSTPEVVASSEKTPHDLNRQPK